MTTATTSLQDQIRQEVDTLALNGSTRDQFVALTVLRKDLDKHLRRIKAEIADREAELLADYSDRGIKGEKDDRTGASVHIIRHVRAGVVNDPAADDEGKAAAKAKACEALKAAGLEAYVAEGFNASSLAAYFRAERDREIAVRQAAGNLEPVDVSALLPAELQGHIYLIEQTSLGMTKS